MNAVRRQHSYLCALKYVDLHGIRLLIRTYYFMLNI